MCYDVLVVKLSMPFFQLTLKKKNRLALGCKASSDFNYFALEKIRDGEGFQVGDNCIKILNVFFVIFFHDE